MVEFFRHCPGCGRRFHVKLENKKLIRNEKKTIPTKRAITPSYPSVASTGQASGYTSSPPTIGTVMIEGKPIILEEKEFQYTYKCGHCGHEWTEKHVEKHREK